eukprot:284819148_4
MIAGQLHLESSPVDEAAAVKIFEKGRAECPQCAVLWLCTIDIYRARKNWSRARAILEEVPACVLVEDFLLDGGLEGPNLRWFVVGVVLLGKFVIPFIRRVSRTRKMSFSGQLRLKKRLQEFLPLIGSMGTQLVQTSKLPTIWLKLFKNAPNQEFSGRKQSSWSPRARRTRSPLMHRNAKMIPTFLSRSEQFSGFTVYLAVVASKSNSFFLPYQAVLERQQSGKSAPVAEPSCHSCAQVRNVEASTC